MSTIPPLVKWNVQMVWTLREFISPEEGGLKSHNEKKAEVNVRQAELRCPCFQGKDQGNKQKKKIALGQVIRLLRVLAFQLLLIFQQLNEVLVCANGSPLYL